MALSHVDANTFAGVFFTESPKDRTAVTFTVADGRATGVDIGDGDGPGTGQLTRRGGHHQGPTGADRAQPAIGSTTGMPTAAQNALILSWSMSIVRIDAHWPSTILHR